MFSLLLGLVVYNKKNNFFQKIFDIFKKKVNGYENFSKFVLQKHASKINRMKTETMEQYENKEKKNINVFLNDVEEILRNF